MQTDQKIKTWIFLLKNQNFFNKIPETRAEMKIRLRCKIIAATRTAGIFNLCLWTVRTKEILIFFNVKIS